MSFVFSFLVFFIAFVFADTPFFGTFQEYRERLKMYKHWSEIKDADVIPPYKATKNDWNPCLSK